MQAISGSLSFFDVVFGSPVLPLDCVDKTRLTTLFPTLSVFILNTKTKCNKQMIRWQQGRVSKKSRKDGWWRPHLVVNIHREKESKVSISFWLWKWKIRKISRRLTEDFTKLRKSHWPQFLRLCKKTFYCCLDVGWKKYKTMQQNCVNWEDSKTKAAVGANFSVKLTNNRLNSFIIFYEAIGVADWGTTGAWDLKIEQNGLHSIETRRTENRERRASHPEAMIMTVISKVIQAKQNTIDSGKPGTNPCWHWRDIIRFIWVPQKTLYFFVYNDDGQFNDNDILSSEAI